MKLKLIQLAAFLISSIFFLNVANETIHNIAYYGNLTTFKI
jgi:hypothetical protein